MIDHDLEYDPEIELDYKIRLDLKQISVEAGIELIFNVPGGI